MKISNQFSVITIVNGRQSHLDNMLWGISQSSLIPDEIIIVGIDETPEVQYSELPVKVYSLQKNTEFLPIAKARNLGAARAFHEHLIFLDVDCIPSKTFFEQILTQGIANNTLIMGNPHYLQAKLDEHFRINFLNQLSISHPHRPNINGLMVATDYMLFWSLAFYIPQKLYSLLEGFDETYTGYGAEDTDLSLKLKSLPNYRLLLSEAKVYHQQHPVYSPPVHQLDSIIQNAEKFYEKWNVWVMDNWLKEFQSLGLIDWKLNGNTIEKIKEPSQKMMTACLKPEAPFM